MKLILTALLVCLATNEISTACAQTITVTPNRILVDETTAVRVTGLKSGEHVVIRGELVDGDGKAWSSEAEFAADQDGMVDVTKQAPVKGEYRDCSAMGLVWSMRPLSKDTHIYRPPHALEPQTIRFVLLRDGKEVSSAEVEQIAIADNVKQIHVDGVLHGVLFVPDAQGKHPGILVVGGSEGGTPTRKAAWLASHGYPSLALAYFHSEGLPNMLQNIPLEYFGRALNWMGQRPEIDKEHLAVVGTSRGGELALQLGSMYPMVRAVVAYVPASVRYGACCGRMLGAAWTLDGQPLGFATVGVRRVSLDAMKAAIHVEATAGPILLISGQDDSIWPSSDMTNELVARLRMAHFAYPVERLDYPHAGHRAGMPEIEPAWHGGLTHPLTGNPENLGGTPEGNAASSLDAPPKVLDFLQRSFAQ
jgi:dienelactone hydrolase